MRPLELVIRGFRSFAERTEIDWRGRRLVGVVGPIGSGKTSILDAIAFALYGKTPVFATESKTLIRHGSDSARVELAFEADGQTWRVIRVIRHSGAGRHVLYRETGEALTSAEHEKKGDVTARVEELLGLDFPTFCRSVLLAQNRFSEFLNATPSERDQVLKGVFGFDRLDEMHKLARDRSADAALALKELEGRLATLDDDEKRLEEARCSLAESEEKLRRFEEVAGEVRELGRRETEARRQAEEARQKRADLDELARQLPADAEVEELAGAAEAASAELASREQEARRTHDAVAEAERRREATVAEVGSAEDLARAESRLDALRHARVQLERKRGRRAELQRSREERRSERDQTRAARDETLEAGERAKAEAERTAEALRQARGEKEAVEREVGDRDVLAGAREDLRRLRVALADLEREAASRRRAEERLATAEDEGARALAESERAAESEKQAEAAHLLATETVCRAEEELRHAEHAEMALTLAKTLEAGKPCPVCNQTVRVAQARLPSESQEHARKLLEAARDTERAAGERLREASNALAAARQKVVSAGEARDAARAELEEASRRVTGHEETCVRIRAALAEALGEGDPEARLASAEERLEAAEARIESGAEEDAKARDAKREADHALELARQRGESAASALAAAEKQLTEADAEIREAETALREAGAELESLLGEGDPEALLTRARSRLSETEATLAAARDAERDTAARTAEARKRLEETRRAREHLASRLARLAGQLGYLEEGAEALAPRELARGIRERLEETRRTTREAEAAAAEDERTARKKRREIHTRLELDADADFGAALAAARSSRDHAGATVEGLEERLGKAAELREERRCVQGRHDLYAQLADDLTASKFLRYLLEQERAALADLGSERFELLSEGRYRFTTDGDFQVIDQHNANAVRKADTLSGGETFLASLALALALAEKVTAGGGRLDAFFLDEGFGSLDPEHLTLAMEGIERLVTDSPNRLVTVVSHVPEMRERIEDLIELDKDPQTGSTIVRRGAKRLVG